MENLIEVELGILLKKFGIGNHKPGSGSAAALQGMLAAQMIRAVVTLSKGREAYKDNLKTFDEIIEVIDTRIYPALTDLIQLDSEQFGKAIEARKTRDREGNVEKRCHHEKEALDSLKVSTEIPITIAKYCIRLTEFGMYAFDNCFQSARGDSSVAINGALSAISGCLSIINLNLLSFKSDEWTVKMRSEADKIKKTRDLFIVQEDDKQKRLQAEADQIHKFHLELNSYVKGMQLNEGLSYAQIEQLVINIQNAMWKYKRSIWKKNIPEAPVDVIDPVNLLKKLGYQYQENESLGNYESAGVIVEIAGIIDTKDKHVSISNSFSLETINFTIAHELGHAILHPNQLLHRDRPMDGSVSQTSSDFKEKQANKFAAFFLMPRKLVLQQFKYLFSTTRIEINTQTAIGLGLRVSELRAKCKDDRDFARIIATTENYNTKVFHSLSEQFQVSAETMAIRLKELDLISV